MRVCSGFVVRWKTSKRGGNPPREIKSADGDQTLRGSLSPMQGRIHITILPSEEVRVRAGTDEVHRRVGHVVNEKPIGLDVAFPDTTPVAR